MDQKIIELEEKLSFLDHTIDELNQVIFRQRQELDEFKDLLKHLSDKIKTLEESGIESTPVTDERPPHY